MFTAALPRQDLLLTLTSWDAILMMRNYSLRCRFSAKLCRGFTFVFRGDTAICFLHKLLLLAAVVIMRNCIRTVEHCAFEISRHSGARFCKKDLQILKTEGFDRERLQKFANFVYFAANDYLR